MTETPTLSPQDEATKKLDALLDKALGFDVSTKLRKGARLRTLKPGAGEDMLQITLKSDEFTKPGANIETLAHKALDALNQLGSIRDNAVLQADAPNESGAQPASAEIKPGTNELRITLNVPVGKADEIIASLAALEPEKLAAPQAAPEAQVTPEAQVAGVAVACPPGEVAVAGAAAAHDKTGAAVAAAAGACVDDAALAAAAQQAAEQKPALNEAKGGVVLPNGQTVANRDIASFVKKHGSHQEQAADKAGTAALGV